MLKTAVVEIAGRQYNIFPSKVFQVDYLGEKSTYECEKVLLVSEDGQTLIGSPYLKEKLIFDVLGKNQRKIRVATYKAKANTRKVTGSKRLVSLIKLQQKETDKIVKQVG
ncbi:50S ribosomal protein L21 [Candidatus Daviesbacteria bacterium]|nr:50S ribosomal protein L21 [Candidatus Daviesbacteria bacterium]